MNGKYPPTPFIISAIVGICSSETDTYTFGYDVA
jgi:hypothetical protein